MNNKSGRHTLIYDIETTPSLGWVWGKWEQNVIDFEKDWHILCFAYKWLGEKKTHVVALPDFKLYKKDPENDYEVVKKLHELFSEAEVLVAHNGNSFDQKKSQARMLYHGMTPPEPYKQIDTKLVAKRYFSFTSNKLDDLGKTLGLGQKLETGGFDTWKGCMTGDMKSWKKMCKYNIQDVVLLEKIYLKMRPWIDTHPPVNNYTQRPGDCPKCGHSHLLSKGYRITKTNRYQRWQCQGCGGYSSSRVAEKGEKPVFV